MMALTDPPRHRELRSPVLPFFSPRGVRNSPTGSPSWPGRSIDEASSWARSTWSTCLRRAAGGDVRPARHPRRDRELVVRVCDEAFLAGTAEERRAGHQKLIPYLFAAGDAAADCNRPTT